MVVTQDKWCILITENNVNALNQYLKDNKDKYIKYTNEWDVSLEKEEIIFFKNQSVNLLHSELTVPKDFTLITTEQFKAKYPQYFESKSVNMQDVLEECKIRFPVGCKVKVLEYKNLNTYLEHTVKEISIHNNSYEDVIKGGNGILYSKKTGYAEIISLPEEKKRKYHISEFTPESNLVIRCTNAEQGNKIAKLFSSNFYPVHDFQKSTNFICWQKFKNDFAWNRIKDLDTNQTLVEFDDIIFDALTKLEPLGDGIWNQIKNYDYKEIKTSYDDQLAAFKSHGVWAIDASSNGKSSITKSIQIKNRTKKTEDTLLPKRVRLVNNRNKFLKTKNK